MSKSVPKSYRFDPETVDMMHALMEHLHLREVDVLRMAVRRLMVREGITVKKAVPGGPRSE